MLPLMEHFLSTNFFMDCSPRKLGKADPLPLSSLILRSERFVNSDMLKGIGPCNKDPSICNVVSLFNFPQKAGSLPEKLVLEILNFSIRMRRPISGGIDPWNSLPSISRSVRVVIFVSTMGNGPDNLFPFSTSPCNFIRAHWAGTPPWNKFLLRCSWRRLGKSAKSGGSSPEKFCPFRYISVTWQAVPLEKEQSYRTQFISSLLESHGPAVRFQLQRGTPSPAAIRRRTRPEKVCKQTVSADEKTSESSTFPVSKELSLGDS